MVYRWVMMISVCRRDWSVYRRCSPRCVPGREDRPGAICLGGRVWTQPVGTLLLPTTTLESYNWDESGEMVPLRPKLHSQKHSQKKKGWNRINRCTQIDIIFQNLTKIFMKYLIETNIFELFIFIWTDFLHFYLVSLPVV